MGFSAAFRAILYILLIFILRTAARVPPCEEGHPRKFEFTITKEKKAPDGFEREFIVVNNQFPGPHLELNEGEEVEIIVHNKMDVNTTIHWHGMMSYVPSEWLLD